MHAAHTVLHNDCQLVSKGWVICDTVGDGRCHQMAVAILVLQAFAVKRGATRCATDQEAASAHVASRPRQIANTLEAEHRVVNKERYGCNAVVGIGSRGGNPVCHAARFVNAFLQDLAGLVFLVEHQLFGILRGVELAHLGENTELAEQAFHTKGARFVRHDRHNQLADIFVFYQNAEHAHKRHGGGNFACFGTFEQYFKRRKRRNLQRCCNRFAHGYGAHYLAAFTQIGHFQAVFRRADKRQIRQLFIGHRNVEAITEMTQCLNIDLLLLMGNILAFARFAHAVTLDGFGQDHGRLPLVF